LLCTAEDSNWNGGPYGTGTASCTVNDAAKMARLVAGNGYTAVFHGDGTRAASQATAPLVG
jgi:hypothetical protein